MILHISTNGASAGTIKQSTLGGTVLPWEENWYEDPVPASLSREDLDRDRIEYELTAEKDESGRSLIETVRRMRTDTFVDLPKYSEIVLWFNSTVGEQLNLIDVLTQLRETSIQVPRYTRVAAPKALHTYSSKQLGERAENRADLSPVLVDRASDAWRVFRTADPTVLEGYIAANSADLPELSVALGRFLEELPATTNGLSRFEALILSALSERERDAMQVMVDHSHDWDDPLFAYIGDRSLQRYLLRLGCGPSPLIEFASGEPLSVEAVWENPSEFFRRNLRLTSAGRRVLDGEDYQALNRPQRWLGPYRLEPGYTDWRWDPVNRSVTTGSAW